MLVAEVVEDFVGEGFERVFLGEGVEVGLKGGGREGGMRVDCHCVWG